MSKAPSQYVATRTLAMPEQGIAYLAIAQVGVGEHHRRHQHDEVQVLWVMAGSLGMVFDGPDEDVLAEVGECLVVPPRTSHMVMRLNRRASSMAQVVDLRVIDDPANPFRRFLAELAPARVFATSGVSVERAAHRLQEAIAQNGLARQAGILSAIWELLATLAPTGGAEASPVGTRLDPRIAQAEEFCRHALSSPLTVDDIAAAVGLSRSQLSRLFYDAYQIGPAERLRQMRVELARHLLSATTLSIKEVAHACGFVRANHFGRVFQQITGKRPSAFRKGGRDA